MIRDLPTVDGVEAQIDEFFAHGERARLRAWTATPEGLARLQEHHDHLAQLPLPRTPEPVE